MINLFSIDNLINFIQKINLELYYLNSFIHHLHFIQIFNLIYNLGLTIKSTVVVD